VSEAPDNLAAEHLLRAIDAIDADVALIELWACALSSFAQPAPDYDFGGKHLIDKYRLGTRNEAAEAA
jgi:hypothetical protein